MRVKELSKCYKVPTIIWGCYTLFISIIYIWSIFVEELNIFSIIFWLIILGYTLFLVRNLIASNKLLKTSMSKPLNSTLEITDKFVRLIKHDDQESALAWDKIERVIINKYSIVFIPKQLEFSFLIGIPVTIKNDVIKSLDKYNKMALLVDNSHRYL